MKLARWVRYPILILCSITGLTACITYDAKTQQSKVQRSATPTPETYLTRDVRDDVFYFVMPDRFYNGNPANDIGSLNNTISQGGLDPTSKWAFHGGDLSGLEQKLDYLKDMGITAIWLTPLLRNQAIQWGGFGHHGYWIVDFTEIDPHFGGNQELKSLIRAAHRKDMKIFFDIITNHTADIIRYRECHNEDGGFIHETTCPYKSTAALASGDRYTPFIPDKFQGVKSPAWLNDPQFYNNQGDSFWQGESAINGDFAGLDDLNTRLPEVTQGMIDIYQALISEFKPDGFRIDTVKHVDLSFWKKFAPAIVKHAKTEGIPNFHIFGEVYDGNAEVLSRYTTAGKLPSVLDFGFQHAAAEFFYHKRSPKAVYHLFKQDDYYADRDSQADLLMNFLGNHDMGRPGYFLNQRLADASEEEKTRRSILSHAFMFMSRGVPVVYYGDEQGFTGDGGDVDAREDMFASQVEVYNDNNLLGTDATTADDNFDSSHPIYQAIEELSALRKKHRALTHGITFVRPVTNEQILAFSRVDIQEQIEYLAVFNNSNEPQRVAFEATSAAYQLVDGKGFIDSKNGHVHVALAPLGYVLLKAVSQVPIIDDLAVNLTSIEQLNERVVINFSLAGAKPAFPGILTLKAYSKIDDKHSFLATDHTPPYRIILQPEQYQALKGQELVITITNGAGNMQKTYFGIQ